MTDINGTTLTVTCCSYSEVMALWIAVSKSMKTAPTVRYFATLFDAKM